MSATTKVSVILCLHILACVGAGYIFNHVSAWLGVTLAFASLISFIKAINVIINKQQKQNEKQN